MHKHNQYQVEKPRNDGNKKVHPVWRGIGCILMVVIPFISYMAATLIINNRQTLTWVIVPVEIVNKGAGDPLLYVKLVYAFAIALILFLIMGVVTFVIDKFFGPPKHGPYDVRD